MALFNILFILLFSFSGSMSVAAAIRFEEIPMLIGEKNQHTAGAKLKSEGAQASKGFLLRSYLPKVNAALGYESFKTGTQQQRKEPYGNINAKINLFNGGKDLLENDMADARASAARSGMEIVLREEIRKARSAYWALVSQRELIKLVEENLAENAKNLESAQSRIRAGAATATDRIEFEMHKTELSQELARLRLGEENTERDFAVLLGFPEGERITTPVFVEHDHKEIRFENNTQTHPAVKSLGFQDEEAALHSSQFGRWWLPSLDVFGSYGLYTFREKDFNQKKERYESVIGVQLSMDLFDGLAANSLRRQKTLEAAGLALEQEQTSRELHAKMEGARAELKLTHDLIHDSDEALKNAKNYLSRTLDEYRRGVKNSPDVLSASERNFAVRKRFAELRRDYQLARALLMEALGL